MNQNFTGTSPSTSNDLHSTIHATCNHIVEIQSTEKHFFDVTKEMMWWSNTSSSNSCSTSTQIYTIFCVDIQIHIKISKSMYCLHVWSMRCLSAPAPAYDLTLAEVLPFQTQQDQTCYHQPASCHAIPPCEFFGCETGSDYHIPSTIDLKKHSEITRDEIARNTNILQPSGP